MTTMSVGSVWHSNDFTISVTMTTRQSKGHYTQTFGGYFPILGCFAFDIIMSVLQRRTRRDVYKNCQDMSGWLSG